MQVSESKTYTSESDHACTDEYVNISDLPADGPEKRVPHSGYFVGHTFANFPNHIIMRGHRL